MWDTMSSCCLTFPTCPVSWSLFIYGSLVGSSSCAADQFIFISSPRVTITEHRRAELCHTLACVDPQSISTGVRVHRVLYVRKSDPADVTGQGPDSVLMGSSTSSLCSQWEPSSLESAWSKALLGSERPSSFVIAKSRRFLLHTGGQQGRLWNSRSNSVILNFAVGHVTNLVLF